MYSLNFSHKLDNSSYEKQANLIYFDIETTGLSKQNALVYLIGCAWIESGCSWHFHQWFAENPDEEILILKAFSDFLTGYDTIVHYNGTTFDIPFLTYRYQFHKLTDPFAKKKSRDLYRELKPLKSILTLPGFKQQDLESFLQITRKDPYTGKDCIQLYRNLIKYRDTSYAQPLLLHNKEDLFGLIQIQSLHSYLSLLKGEFSVGQITHTSHGFSAQLAPKVLLPGNFQYKYDFFSLTGQGDTLFASFYYEDGYLRNYYSDYKNYYYLPAQDIAIHKSVGSFLDRSHRVNARKENCYTRFLPTPDFFQSPSQVEHYLQNNIPILLSLQKTGQKSCH